MMSFPVLAPYKKASQMTKKKTQFHGHLEILCQLTDPFSCK